LVLDLDETLIHTCSKDEHPDVILTLKGDYEGEKVIYS